MAGRPSISTPGATIGPLHLEDLRGRATLLRLDLIDDTVPLVRADIHRDGLRLPQLSLRRRQVRRCRRPSPLGFVTGELETEGFGIKAMDLGRRYWVITRSPKSCTRPSDAKR